jgi:hypothetical protein
MGAGAFLLLGTSAVIASSTDWPVYRHDRALSGVSPGQGWIVKPEIKWEYYLGATRVAIATDGNAEPPDTADLDSDGTPEKFSINGNTIQVTDLSGRPLWSYQSLGPYCRQQSNFV